MEIKDKTIALLIDSDNISHEYFSVLLDELSQYGRITYRRLYGDFTKPKANGWQAALLKYSIEQIQQIAFTRSKEDGKRKEATDESMIIDAMDILYTGKVDCFCLATCDSDFTKLAMRLRNDNIAVIGAGGKQTPDSFRNACERFIPIEELLQTKDSAGKTKPLPKPTAPVNQEQSRIETKRANLIKMVKSILLDGADIDGLMNFSTFMNEVYRKENEFNPKLYGHTNSSAASFFKSLADKSGKTVFTLDKVNNCDRIRLKK